MNSVNLIGRLTNDPEITYTNGQNGQMAIARYTLAVDRIKEGTDFIRCVAFGSTGQFAEKYLHKGMKIGVSGRIQTGSYKDKDGKTVYTTDIVVNSHTFCEKREISEQAGTEFMKNPNTPDTNNNDEFMKIPDNVDDSGLPFNF